MALDFIKSLLTTKGLEIAEPFFSALIDADASRTTQSLLDLGRRLGFSYTDENARTLINQLRANASTAANFQLTGLTQLPGRDALITAKGPLDRNYTFFATITGFNPFTGERETRGTAVVSDVLLTPEQIIGAVLQKAENPQLYSALSNSFVEVTKGYRSKYAPD